MHEQWGAGDPELEAIRRANLLDEACFAAFVRYSHGFAVLGYPVALLFLSLPLGHSVGVINAPWVAKPIWVAFFASTVAIPLLFLGVGDGLYRRKAWVLPVATLLAVNLMCLMVFGPILGAAGSTTVVRVVAQAVFALVLITPYVKLWKLVSSVVFRSDYPELIAATPHIRVKPKLPLGLKAMMLTVSTVFLGLWIHTYSA